MPRPLAPPDGLVPLLKSPSPLDGEHKYVARLDLATQLSLAGRAFRVLSLMAPRSAQKCLSTGRLEHDGGWCPLRSTKIHCPTEIHCYVVKVSAVALCEASVTLHQHPDGAFSRERVAGLRDAATQGPKMVLETRRLLLRPWRVAEATVQRELWTERDPRVPPRRRIDADGNPTVEDLEDAIRTQQESSVELLAIERKAERGVIGYCGLVDRGRGPDGEPERNTASRRVLAKVGFVETERREVHAVYGTTLFTTRQL